jgi:hypothetical protein
MAEATRSLSPNRVTQRLLKHRVAVATLAKQAAVKAVKHRLRADGVRLYELSAKARPSRRVGSCGCCNEQVGPQSSRLLFTLTCCAMPAAISSPTMGTTLDPLLTTLVIAICNRPQGTRRWQKAGLRNSGRTNSRDEVGQTEARQPKVWPYHDRKGCPARSWRRQAYHFCIG